MNDSLRQLAAFLVSIGACYFGEFCEPVTLKNIMDLVTASMGAVGATLVAVLQVIKILQTFSDWRDKRK